MCKKSINFIIYDHYYKNLLKGEIIVIKQYVWDEKWILRDESFYSVFEKFKYLNSLSINDILDKLKVSTCVKYNLNYLHDIIPKQAFQSLFGFDLVSDYTRIFENLTKPYPNTARSSGRYLFAEKLRYCPQCMLERRHSIFHQCLLIKTCPIHTNTLQTVCKFCNSSRMYNTFEDQTTGCLYCLFQFNDLQKVFNGFKTLRESSSFNFPDLKETVKTNSNLVIFNRTLNKIDLLKSLENCIQSKTLKSSVINGYSNNISSSEIFEELYVRNKQIYKSVARYIRKRLKKLIKGKQLGFCSDLHKDSYKYAYWRATMEAQQTMDRVDNGRYRRTQDNFDYFSLYISRFHSLVRDFYYHLTNSINISKESILRAINTYAAELMLEYFHSLKYSMGSLCDLESKHQLNSEITIIIKPTGLNEQYCMYVLKNI